MDRIFKPNGEVKMKNEKVKSKIKIELDPVDLCFYKLSGIINSYDLGYDEYREIISEILDEIIRPLTDQLAEEKARSKAKTYLLDNLVYEANEVLNIGIARNQHEQGQMDMAQKFLMIVSTAVRRTNFELLQAKQNGPGESEENEV
nr:hypothetical protein [uncultured Mediterranean phage uvMED]